MIKNRRIIKCLRNHTQAHLKLKALIPIAKAFTSSIVFFDLILYTPPCTLPNSITSFPSFSMIKLLTEDTRSSKLNFSLKLYVLVSQVAFFVFNF